MTGGSVLLGQSRRQGGWTLPELLVAMAVIVLLVGILGGVFALVRHRSRETTCLSNLHQLGLALKMYEDDWKELPPRLEVLYPKYVRSKAVFFCPSMSPERAKEFAHGARWSPYEYWPEAANRIHAAPLDGLPTALLGSRASWAEGHARRGEEVPLLTCRAHTAPNQLKPGQLVRLVARLDGSCARVDDRRRPSDRLLFWYEW